jgi:hypothetical protein
MIASGRSSAGDTAHTLRQAGARGYTPPGAGAADTVGR